MAEMREDTAEYEPPEPLIVSMLLAPFRLVKSVLKKIIGRFWPALDYELEQRKKEKADIDFEVQELLASTRELERRLEKLEKET